MSWAEPTPSAASETPSAPEEPLRAFLRDQMEAVAILREEKADERVNRRIDACHLAMRYLDQHQPPGQSHSPSKVIAVAKTFERYLLEP